MFCWHCGAQVPDEARFCPKCGKSLVPGGKKEPPPKSDVHKRSILDTLPPEARQKLTGLLIGLAAICVIGGVLMFRDLNRNKRRDPVAPTPSLSAVSEIPAPTPTPDAVEAGTFTYKGGEVYEGEMKNGLPNGYGVITFTEDSSILRYEGDVVDGMRDGRGAIWYRDGGSYEGGWADDKRHGDGVYIFPEGIELSGTWENGKKEGTFTRTLTNGDVYTQEYRNDERISSEKVSGTKATPKPTQKPASTPAPTKAPSASKGTTLLAEALEEDPLAYTVTPDSRWIQDPRLYFGDDLECRKVSNGKGYTVWDFHGDYEPMKDYVELLCGGGYNLKVADSYYKYYPASGIAVSGGENCSWLIDYTGTGTVSQTTDTTYLKGKGNIGIYGYSQRAGGPLKFVLHIPNDLQTVDLGLRHSGGNVTVGAKSGSSTAAGLYRLKDGSFQTSDGRLTAKPGQAAVLRDGTSYTAPTEFVLRENTSELWVKDFYRGELLYVSTPTHALFGGEQFTMADILKKAWWRDDPNMNDLSGSEVFGGYNWSLCVGAGHNGDYVLPTDQEDCAFENILVRILHWDEGNEGVYYVYASFKNSPKVVEALCAVDLTKAIDGTGRRGTGNSDGDCDYCGGDGRCPVCDGSGTVSNWLPGTPRTHLEQRCTDCYSPGKCRICGGDGER